MKAVLIRVLIVALIFTTFISIGYHLKKPKERLRVFNPADLNPALVSDSLRSVKKGHVIRDFLLINQNSDTITSKNFDKKIYVTNFFFATCPNICPLMNKQLHRVYLEFKNDSNIAFLSHTSMPEKDSPKVLFEYAKKYEAFAPKWQFVTGNKKEIYDLARNYYLSVKTKGNGDEYDFIHTENFVLVDQSKQIRGFYDGTSEDDVDRLIDDIAILKNENE